MRDSPSPLSMVTIGYAVPGHSYFRDEVWETLKDLPDVTRGIRSVYPYDHIDYVGLIVLSGATAHSWECDGNDNDRGIALETDDLDEFLRRLEATVRNFIRRR